MLGRAMHFLHMHALRCLDDADERVRVAACSTCCRLLARAAVDARSSAARASLAQNHSSGSNNQSCGVGGGSGVIAGGGVGVGLASTRETFSVASLAGSGTNTPRSRSATPTFGENPGDVNVNATNAAAAAAAAVAPAPAAVGLALGGGSGGGGLRGGGLLFSTLSGGGERDPLAAQYGLALSESGFGEAGAFGGWGDRYGGGFGLDSAAAWARGVCLEVLERLLTVGLADASAAVRQEVVGGLEVRYTLFQDQARCIAIGCMHPTAARKRQVLDVSVLYGHIFDTMHISVSQQVTAAVILMAASFARAFPIQRVCH